METQIAFLVGMFFPLALAAGLGLFIIAVIEGVIAVITDVFNG